ncbi:MAG TPA: glutathione S-transferase family protein [Sphingobium sp.]
MIRLIAGSGEAAAFGLVFALEELGAPFVLEPIDLRRFVQWSPQHRALSTDGNPVVLDMDGQTMDRPLLALLYLAETKPESRLLPDDPTHRYAVQATIAQFDHALGGGIRYLGWLATVTQRQRDDYAARLNMRNDRPVLAGWSAVWRDAVSEEQRADDARAKVRHGIEQVAALLSNRRWLIGDEFTVADIATFALLRQLPRIGFDLVEPDGSALSAWFQRVGGRPSAQLASARIAEVGLGDVFDPPIYV